jgi:hypothetical protein
MIGMKTAETDKRETEWELTPWIWVVLEKPLVAQLIISQYFMQPDGSLRCSQEPATGHYPEPDESRQYHPILFLPGRSHHRSTKLSSFYHIIARSPANFNGHEEATWS